MVSYRKTELMVNFWKKTKYLDAVGDAFASYIDYARFRR